jgi:hypothetical protein
MKRIITLGIVGAMSLATMSRAAESLWTKKTGMPTPRMCPSTSVVGGRIYAMGGAPDIVSSLGTVEEYDPATDTWRARSAMPTTRWGLSTCAVNGKIYAIGGAIGHPASTLWTVEEYDPVTNTWKSKSPMPTPRWGLSTAVVGGKVYAVGGMAPIGSGSQTVEEYDPATDSWTTKTPMTTGRYAFAACAVNGKIYALGGVTRYPGSTATVEEYDPAKDGWTVRGSMLGAKAYFAACEVNGRIYALGGAPHPDGATAVVYEYDPAANTCIEQANMLSTRTVLSASAVGGRIYAIGGSTSPVPWLASGLTEAYPVKPAIMDFDGDGKVDAKDMGVLVDNWGKNNSLCDIGPFPWGDGVVDEKDLGVLMESLVTPSLKASGVLCDATLSWASPSFTETHDVYLGTSREAVTTASRENPLGVLVSQGQTATTYDPAAPLELSRTYYWRVDFVSADAAPAIYQGPVLEFTTAALTYQIKNITATASSAQVGSGPERTVDGSGLDKNDGHSMDQKYMWWTLPTSPHWIQYEFDKVYTLHEMWVWNFNMMVEPYTGFGAKTVKIEYSTDGTTWTPLADVPEFLQAPGRPGYTANTIVSFAAVPAKFVKLTIEKNWSTSAQQTGLSEVRFFAIQSTAVPKP